MLAASKNLAESKILAARENQAESKILAARESQADNRSIAGVEIPALGEKTVFEEKLVESEKQAAFLLFRLGGISNC
jgi:hypothetical protein